MPLGIKNLLLKAKLESGNTQNMPNANVQSNNEPAHNFNPEKFETKLSPEEEKKFQVWLDKNHKEGKIGTGDYNFYKKNGYGYDYDFRAAYKHSTNSNLNLDDNKIHWGDIGKKPNHPTFSNESIYYSELAEPGIGGRWDKTSEHGRKKDIFVKNPTIGPPIPPAKEVLIKLKEKKK